MTVGVDVLIGWPAGAELLVEGTDGLTVDGWPSRSVDGLSVVSEGRALAAPPEDEDDDMRAV